MAHARCSASTAGRWWECSASVDDAAQYPNPESKYAAEGTAAHAVAANVLIGVPQANVNDHILLYTDYVEALGGQRWIEVDLTPGLEKLHQDLGGTADAIVLAGDTLHVTDLKYGRGIVVGAEDNLQLKIYALGALLTVNRPGIKTVKATIVQPRAFHPDGPIRTWTFPAYDLLEFAADLVEHAERTRTDRKYKAGDHCRFCPARDNCDERARVRQLEELAVLEAFADESEPASTVAPLITF